MTNSTETLGFEIGEPFEYASREYLVTARCAADGPYIAWDLAAWPNGPESGIGCVSIAPDGFFYARAVDSDSDLRSSSLWRSVEKLLLREELKS